MLIAKTTQDVYMLSLMRFPQQPYKVGTIVIIIIHKPDEKNKAQRVMCPKSYYY